MAYKNDEDRKAYHRKWYQNNKQKVIERSKARISALRETPLGQMKLRLQSSRTAANQGNYQPCSASPKELLESFVDECEICGSNDTLHLDHCHSTGRFRGWLCHKCNTAIGLLQEDKTLIQRCLDYLGDVC